MITAGEHYESILDAVVAKQASETERRAEEAERETVKLKKCEYMSNHIGECFGRLYQVSREAFRGASKYS